MSRAEEYRASLYVDVKLPSGFTFKVRKVGPLAVARIMSEHNLTVDQINEGSMEFNIAFLEYAVVDPKLVSSDPKDDELQVEDLTNEDVKFLLNKIIDISGLSSDKNPLQKQK